MSDIDEFYAIGGTEYFSKGISIIEWGELIKDALPKEYIEVKFSKDEKEDFIRYLCFIAHGERLEKVINEL